jgi:translation initiation factor 2B subunit (eIF-2B alpha/beta/delta family)
MLTPKIDAELNEIINDQIHGSSFILNRTLTFFEQYPDLPEIHHAIQQFRKVDQSMVIVHHFLDAYEQSGLDMNDFLVQYKQEWAGVEERVVQRLEPILPDDPFRIITHSNSHLVQYVLRKLSSKKEMEVFQTHSEPGNEGLIQAKDLNAVGLNVQLVEDSGIEHVKGINICLLGCDQFTQKNFVNKVGSGRILSQFQNQICLVLADTRKKVKSLVYNPQLFEVLSFKKLTLITEEGVYSY